MDEPTKTPSDVADEQAFADWADRARRVSDTVGEALELVRELGTGPKLYPFEPDWTVGPGSVLRAWMRENGVDAAILATMAAGKPGRDDALKMIEAVLAKEPLTEEIAAVLQHGTQVPAGFWLGFEAAYRNGLAAGLMDAGELLTHRRRWSAS